MCFGGQTLHSVVLHLVQAQGEVWSQLPIIANATSLRISELKTDPTQVTVAWASSISILYAFRTCVYSIYTHRERIHISAGRGRFSTDAPHLRPCAHLCDCVDVQVEAEIGEEIRSGAKAEQARQLQQEAPPVRPSRQQTYT